MEVLELIRDRPNICKSIHLPAQSGSNRILSLMRRNYTREAYFELVERIYSICGPEVTLSSDFICGFCGETADEFQETLDLVQRVPYSMAFIFPYSMREVGRHGLMDSHSLTRLIALFFNVRKHLLIDVMRTMCR